MDQKIRIVTTKKKDVKTSLAFLNEHTAKNVREFHKSFPVYS